MEFINEITVSYKPILSAINNEGITFSKKAYHQALTFYDKETINMQEQFVVLYLSQSNKLLGGYTHSLGGLTSTTVDVRLILATALKTLATSLILVHNHPSGRLEASEMDKQITKRIKEAGNIMDIKVLDHLIISPQNYFSFADEGLL